MPAAAENARAVVRRYRKRWTIEEFFRIPKSGLRVEERRFDHAEDLRKCFAFAFAFAFDAATACRVFEIARAAKETPDVPAVDIVPEDAPRVLKRALRSRGVRPKAPPIRESASTHCCGRTECEAKLQNRTELPFSAKVFTDARVCLG